MGVLYIPSRCIIQWTCTATRATTIFLFIVARDKRNPTNLTPQLSFRREGPSSHHELYHCDCQTLHCCCIIELQEEGFYELSWVGNNNIDSFNRCLSSLQSHYKKDYVCMREHNCWELFCFDYQKLGDPLQPLETRFARARTARDSGSRW